MTAPHPLVCKYARQYAKVGKADGGALLDALVATTGWTRDHARRAIRNAVRHLAPSHLVVRKPRPRKYSYDALMILQEVWRLAGRPSGQMPQPW
ncbi:MAG: hypothetical protein IPH27_16515 [Actinomycetales bacterium]|nr:hypothetical protein [Candidatus Phosphoribacter baldrii]